MLGHLLIALVTFREKVQRHLADLVCRNSHFDGRDSDHQVGYLDEDLVERCGSDAPLAWEEELLSCFGWYLCCLMVSQELKEAPACLALMLGQH